MLDGFKQIGQIHPVKPPTHEDLDQRPMQRAPHQGIEVVETEEGLRAKISKRNLFKAIDDVRIAFEEERIFVREEIEMIKAQINTLTTQPNILQDETGQESTILEDLGSIHSTQQDLLA